MDKWGPTGREAALSTPTPGKLLRTPPSIMAPLNILIHGAGGIGCTYALILSQPALKGKVNVHVVARSNLQHIRDNGLDYDSVKFGKLQGVKFAGGAPARKLRPSVPPPSCACAPG
jgi:hypothetical protein